MATTNSKTDTSESSSSQRRRVAVITGGGSGVGLEATRQLIQHGWHVIIGVRSVNAALTALAEIPTHAEIPAYTVESLDLSDADSVKTFATTVAKHIPDGLLDALICNAAVVGDDREKEPTSTPKGYEKTFATNHLGHFILTGSLMPLLEKAHGRVVMVSAKGHRFSSTVYEQNDLQLRTTP